MINNYFILLWRKAKTWSFLFWVNIFGFIIGLSLVELIVFELINAIKVQTPWAPFLALALGVLVIITFNFANFTALEIRKRFGETGLRKLLGAAPGQIVIQFMLEALVIVVISVLMSLVLTELIEPYINQLFGYTPTLLRQQSLAFQLLLPTILIIWLSIFGSIIPVWRFAHITIKDMLPNLKSATKKL